MKIEGHHGEIYSLIIGKHGDLIISASRDRSIRFWEQTDEPVKYFKKDIYSSIIFKILLTEIKKFNS